MSSFTQLSRLSNCVISGYRNLFYGRTNWLNPVQVCNYTKKSAEERLGIDKPKRPLTPFLRFLSQIRPALLAKNPGLTTKEAIAWGSKHWKELDTETKSQLQKEFEKDMEDYRKIKAIYESSLTEQQKEDIKKVKEEMAEAKEKRKLKAEYKELGRPKRPLSSYFLFMQSRNDKLQGKTLKEYQQKIKEDWYKLPGDEKLKFEKQAQELMNKYRKDMEAWELKMISIGRMDLVRSKPVTEKKNTHKKQ